VLGPLDGLPLNGRAEALLLGIVVPSLIWFDRRSLQRTPIRVAIIALLAVKAAGLMLTPQGLCARFSTTAPFVGETHTIPIDEPEGWLRSWDVRRQLARSDARVHGDRRSRLRGRALVSGMVRQSARFDSPWPTDLALDLSGSMHVSGDGVLTLSASEGHAV
jgi:hypothetical protein